MRRVHSQPRHGLLDRGSKLDREADDSEAVVSPFHAAANVSFRTSGGRGTWDARPK